MHLTSVDEIPMRDKIQTPLRKNTTDVTLDRAIQRVYDIYGSDLARFFAVVKKQQHAQAVRESSERENAPEKTSV